MAELLPELLDANLRRGASRAPLEIGFLNRAGRVELAELLSGTTRKSSREYKSAYKRVERWQKRGTGRITPRSQKQLDAARRSFANPRHDAFRRRGADMRVQIEWYEGRRTEWIPPHRWVQIPASVMRHVLQTWSENDVALAAGELYSAFLERYEVPNIDDWQRETEVIDLALEPSK